MRLFRAARPREHRAAVLAVLALLVLPATPASAGPAAAGPAAVGPVTGQDRPRSTAEIAAAVAQLDRDVTRVSDQLARGAAAYEAAQARLARATEGQFVARDSAEARRTEALASRSSFGVLARSAYKGGLPPMVTALLSGDPRAVADLVHVRQVVAVAAAERHEQLRAAERRGTAADLRLAESDVDRRSALALRQLVEQRLARLQDDADRLTADLHETAARLEQARAADRTRERARLEAARRAAAQREAQRRAEALRVAAGAVPPSGSGPLPLGAGTAGGSAGGGYGCQPPGPYGEANGFLSPEGLCALAVGGGHRLRTDAARAFDRLSAAHVAATGAALCVTDSYRSYAAQVDVFRRKPGLAATPGRSQHGWGLAVDLCGGVQVFGSPQHEWLRAHAPAFGWVHPAWAGQGGSKPEPWHWEYVGG